MEQVSHRNEINPRQIAVKVDDYVMRGSYFVTPDQKKKMSLIYQLLHYTICYPYIMLPHYHLSRAIVVCVNTNIINTSM